MGSESKKGNAKKGSNFRTLFEILKHAGFGRVTAVFAVVFVLCAVVLWLSDPATNTLGDGLWFSFEAVTTIGFGDVYATTALSRAVTVVLSVLSIFYIAMLTGVAASYCNAVIKVRQQETLARFIDDLEHLEDLDREELAALSAKVREYGKRR